jgi:hypothetical protein
MLDSVSFEYQVQGTQLKDNGEILLILLQTHLTQFMVT